MNIGDPCPKCTKATWLYDPSTLTCKDGHRTSVGAPVPSRPLVVVSRRHVPAFAWAFAGAVAAVVVDHL